MYMYIYNILDMSSPFSHQHKLRWRPSRSPGFMAKYSWTSSAGTTDNIWIWWFPKMGVPKKL